MSAVRRGRVVPLFAPAASWLRAGALWVEIANWADGLSDRYGTAEVVTPDGRADASEARKWAFGHSYALTHQDASIATGRSRSGLEELARTAVKDLRSVARGVTASRWACRLPLDRYSESPYVWQIHMPFQRSGVIAARRLGVPLVLAVDAPQVWEASRWGVERPGWGRLIERFGEKRIFREADLLVCVSDEVAQQVRVIAGGDVHTVVAPCTAQVPSQSLRDARRSELGLDGKFAVGWVGSFRPFHHVELLVRAVAAMSTDRHRVALVLVGDGPTRERCASLATELGVEAHFTGSVPHDEVAGYLQACDAGALPVAAGESFHYSPLKLKEFMAVGLPAVVPRIGEMERLLTADREACFYEPGGFESMAASLDRLVGDEALRRSLAVAGLRLAQEEFSIHGHLELVAEALKLCDESGL